MGEKVIPHLVQLATRVPVDLYKRIKLHCVKEEISIMTFVTGAIEKALKK